MKGWSSHPDAGRLALFAGSDLPWLERGMVWMHVASCSRCRGEVEAFQEASEVLADENERTLEEFPESWQRLEAEMRANIRLGLAAGAIVDEPGREPRPDKEPAMAPSWEMAVVAASLVIVLASGWYLRRPVSNVPTIAEVERPAVVVEAQDAGIGIQEKEGGMTLLRPASQSATVAVDFGAGARAQYVNGETGQVTIHQVYVDE